MSSVTEKSVLHPLLLAAIEAVDQEIGVYVKELKIGDILELATQHHFYVLRVVDPAKGMVELTGDNPEFSDSLETCVVGSRISSWGMAIKPDWIAVGYRLELARGLVLSRITSIKLNGQAMFCMQKYQLN